ncbi:Serine/threonine-protein kinase HT1 [Leucoagaricus sp. SymC.cos]|nr:Serine/threonine-protein kinase HT1 [Leucoagaricus sp. SymC.cos]
MRKHMTIALYNLCRTNKLYPTCLLLNDIVLGPPKGGGIFSDVYKGRHPRMGQNLCVKVVRFYERSHIDAMLKAYAKEAMLWRQLHHPSIIPLYGVHYLRTDKSDESYKICLVSPWMENGNLVKYLSNNPEVPREPLIYDIALGLEYMHSELSLIHGDLKGSNILVNDEGHACITDFGLSILRTESTLSRALGTNTVGACSYRWSAPEIVDDLHPTPASDIWAFGCVCYEVLTGNLPFPECITDAQVIIDLADQIKPAEKPWTVTQREDIIWSLIDKCWEIDTRKRPTCGEIIATLEEIFGVAREPSGLGMETLIEHGRQLFQLADLSGNVRDSELEWIEELLHHENTWSLICPCTYWQPG